ncbi:hypothetical protein [Actinophytocola sediminis]
MTEWWRWGVNPSGTRYAGRLHIVLDAPARHGAWTACGLWVAIVTTHRPAADRRVLCPECCLSTVDHIWPPP